jgi:hypothetical protein
MAALDKNDLAILMKLCKRGRTLVHMRETLRVDEETIFAALGRKIGISAKLMRQVIVQREHHTSLAEISEICSVPLESLKEIFPESSLPADLIYQISTLSKEGRTCEEISHSTGIPEAEVMIALKSHPNSAASVASTEKNVPSRVFGAEVVPVLNSGGSHPSSSQAIGPPSEITVTSNARKGRVSMSEIGEGHVASNPVEVKRQGKKTWANADFYEGELLNEEPHGVGTMRYSNARSYVGEWVRGKMHGRGVYTYPLGTKYEGEFMNDAICIGTGKFVDGEVYTGSFKDGKKHGHGTQTLRSGESYEGSWENDFRHGEGTCKYANGGVYMGSWHYNQRQGHGVFEEGKQSDYTGLWKEDKRHGHGAYKHRNGEAYEGEWSKDLRHGQGTHKLPNGQYYQPNDYDAGRVERGMYIGRWKNDKIFVKEEGCCSRAIKCCCTQTTTCCSKTKQCLLNFNKGWNYKLFEPQLKCYVLFLLFCPWQLPIQQGVTALHVFDSYLASLQAFVCACCFACFGAGFNRKRIRDEREIPGNYFQDVLLHLFCGSCAVIQELTEL